MSLIIRAAQFAARAHAGQFRKHSGRPYITHPAEVAGRVSIHPIATEETVAVAWLHDVIEDCGVTTKTLTADFGSLVSMGVCALTKASLGSKAPRYERWELDLQKLRGIHADYKPIKLLDRICNINDYCRDFSLIDAGGKRFLREVYLPETADLLFAFIGVDCGLEQELDAATKAVNLMLVQDAERKGAL